MRCRVFRTRNFGAAVCIAGSLAIGACGSTSPSAPTPVATYPSLLGATTPWRESDSSLVLRDRNSNAELSYNCDAQMNIGAQTAGTFTGGVTVQGVDPVSDKQCTFVSGFTAQMTPDGTVTSLHLNAPFIGVGCAQPTDTVVTRGTVTSTTIRFEIADRPTCQDPGGRTREFDRTLTLSVRRVQ